MGTEALLTLCQTVVPLHVWIYLSSQNSWKKSLCWGGTTSRLPPSMAQRIRPACSHISLTNGQKASIYCLVFSCSYQVAFFCHFKGSISMGLPWKHTCRGEAKRERDGWRRKRISYFVMRTCLNERLQWWWKLTKMSIDFECFIRLDAAVD